MNWKDIFKLKSSLFSVAIFGLIAGLVGYAYGNNLYEKFSEKERNFLYAITPIILIGFFSRVNLKISKEIESETENKVSEKIDLELANYQEKLKDDIEDIREEIYKANIPLEKRDSILEKIIAVRDAHDNFKNLRESAKKIVQWLDKKDNKLTLLNAALDAVQNSELAITEEYMTAFDQDIRECIMWLRHSINDHRACTVELDRYASAIIRGLPSKYQPYHIAMNAIKEQTEISKFSSKISIINDMIDYLNQRIKKMSEELQ